MHQPPNVWSAITQTAVKIFDNKKKSIVKIQSVNTLKSYDNNFDIWMAKSINGGRLTLCEYIKK